MFTEKNKLSIEQCKQYLPRGRYTDAQVEEMRDSLYQLAGILVEEHLKTRKERKI